MVSIYEPDPANNNSLTLQTNYAYNVLNELTTVTPIQGSQTRSYIYDALGRLLSATTPESGRVCFGSVTSGTCNADGYDSFDNLLKRTDARGVLTTYGYDTLNRLTSVSYNVTGTTAQPTPSVGFSYGNDSSCNSAHGAGCIGQLITMTDGPGSENYTYNNLEQLSQLQKGINGTTYTTSYAYNLAGELTQITYPSLRVVQQSVDAVGRLCEIAPSTTGCGTAASPYATGYAYNAAGLPTVATGFKYGNGIYASFGFSADRLQLNCLDYSTSNRNGNCSNDSTTKFGLTYSYGTAGSNDGLISGISDNSGTQEAGRSVNYTYDSLYHLTQAITTGSSGYPQWALSEAYDRYGNRTGQAAIQGYGCTGCPTNTVGVDVTTNRINSGGYGYDSSGNMTNDGLNTLVYDAENHAVSATNGGSAGAYVYDGNGLRVQKCLPSCGGSNPNTVYIFSGSKVIAEYDNGAVVGSPSREYIYSGAALLAKIDSSGTKYYHQDHLSNRYVTDSSGNKAAEMGHFPYGESWYNATSDKLLFTTYERDSESGNDYAMARYYVSRIARFSSPDPIGGSATNPQSLNRYSYARNAPVDLLDPSGLTPHPCNTIKNFVESPDVAGGPSAGDDFGPAEPQNCGGSGGSGGGTCSIDGGDVPCDLLGALAPSESAANCSNGGCSNAPVTGQNGQQYFIVPGVDGLTWIDANGEEVDPQTGCDEPAGSCLPELDQGLNSGAPQGPAMGALVNAAVARALEALKNPKCRGLFADSIDPSALLKSLANDNGLGAIQIGYIDQASVSANTVGITGAYYSYAGNGTFVGPISQFIGATITISNNPLGPYMAGYPGTNDQATSRAATIIHELGHAANIIYGTGSAGIFQDVFNENPKTATGSIISMANTRNVMENCF